MNVSDWGKFLAPIVAAVLASWGLTASATKDQVNEEQFQRVAIENCSGINELKGTLREVILSAPVDPDRPLQSQEFQRRALALLQPNDCIELIQIPR